MAIDTHDEIPGTDHALLTHAEVVALSQAYRDGDADARDALYAHNVRLVVGIARKYVGQGLELADLVQEGSIGLLRAIDLYDPDRGFQFSTYATYWVRQAMGRALADKGRAIRLPVHLNERLHVLRGAVDRLAGALGGEPSDAEVAAELGWPVAVVQKRRAADLLSRCDSLDRRMAGDDLTLVGLIGQMPDFEAGIEAHERRALLARLLARLGEDERGRRQHRVLELRYGLVDGQPRTLEEVGRALGITRERARQLEASALERLRRAADFATPVADLAA